MKVLMDTCGFPMKTCVQSAINRDIRKFPGIVFLHFIFTITRIFTVINYSFSHDSFRTASRIPNGCRERN
uniref:Uncharacterized protein n=1 Tax=Heterorhabditis bacteriophora TaxID=37862 RepID=A0A1I7X3N6_HETBA